MKLFIQNFALVCCCCLLSFGLNAQDVQAVNDAGLIVPAGAKIQFSVIGNDDLMGIDPMDVTVEVISVATDVNDAPSNDIVGTSGSDICYTADSATAPGNYTFDYRLYGPNNSSDATVTVTVTDVDDQDPEIICPPDVVLICEPECVCLSLSLVHPDPDEAIYISGFNTPQGFVGVYGYNPFNPGPNHAAVISTTPAPTADPDLGTPNTAFGGTGVGTGGEPGLYQNDIEIGNVLIVANNLVGNANDQCCNLGSDQVYLDFDFSAIGPITMKSVDIFDLDDNAQASGVALEMYDAADVLITSIGSPATGDNGHYTLFANVSGVFRVRYIVNGSGSIDDFCFTKDIHTPTGRATATDDSGIDPTVRFFDVNIDTLCNDYNIITRRWRAIDCAGNVSSCNQIITSYDDKDAPVLVDGTCPENTIVDCTSGTDPGVTGGPPSFTDDCADADLTDIFELVITMDDVTLGDDCSYTITRTWTATDDCGNTATCEQTITVADLTGPDITCPEDDELECDEVDGALTVMATATDVCSDVVSITFDDVTVADPQCPNAYTITRTFTATDDCDNTTTCVQTIDVVDTTPPSIDCPADIIIECDVIPTPDNTGMASATDNCGMATVTFTDVETPGDCVGESTIARTWTATDACGLSADCVQDITISDTTPPVITCPGNMTLECDELGGSGGGQSVVFEFTGAEQQFIVPAGVTSIMIEAKGASGGSGDIGGVGGAGEGGQASGALSVTPGEILFIYVGGVGIDPIPDGIGGGGFNGGGDAGSLERGGGGGASDVRQSGTALTDRVIVAGGGGGSCGVSFPGGSGGGFVGEDTNTTATHGLGGTQNSGGQVIGGNDSCQPGEFGIGGSDAFNTACAGGGAGWYGGGAGCGGGGGSSYIEGVSSGMTTTGGRTGNGVVTISYGAGPNTGTASAIDNCTDEPTITSDDVIVPGSCDNNYTINRTWTATDDCDNTSTCLQVITVEDTTPPEMDCPADQVIDCDVYNPATDFGTATATDNCDDAVTVTVMDVTMDGSCLQEFKVTRTFTATDECLNTNTCAQIIMVQDTTNPVCENVVLVVDCTVDVSTLEAFPYTAYSDNCDEDLTLIFDGETVEPGNCPANKDLKRTWVILDDCGNTNSCIQTIEVRDTKAPVLTCPEDVIVECADMNIPANADLGMASATDDCSTFEIDVDDVTLDSDCFDIAKITRTYTATDACGNSASCMQMITVQDTEDPMITCPPNMTVECDASIDPMDTGVATATDDCDNDPDISGSGMIVPSNTCPQEFTMNRTWTATDCSGNTASCLQVIDVVDTTPPVIVECAGDATIECDLMEFVDFGAFATDNCDQQVDIDDMTLEIPGNCAGNYQVVITYTATDDCDNTATCSQTITVEDTQGPDITCPEMMEIECTDDQSPASLGMASATDECSGASTPTFTDYYCTFDDVVVGFSGDFDQSNWTATTEGDAQVIPSGSGQEVTLISADDGTNGAEANYSIVFPYTGFIAFLYDYDTDDGPFWDPFGYSIDGQFTMLTDDDGPNSQTGTQIVFVEAGQTFSFTQATTDGIFGSGATFIAQILTVEPVIADPSDLACQSYFLKRVWSSVDDCGNESNCVQVVLVEDTQGPDVMCGDDITVECDAIGDIDYLGMASATDACSDVVDLTFEISTDNDNCQEIGYISVTYTATDACGNTGTCSKTIRVLDTTPPGIMCPDNATVECGMDTSPAATGTASATDNCTDIVGVDSEDGAFMSACGETGSFDRTWTATDNCDNTSTCVQTITIVDTTPPDIDCPADADIECDQLQDLNNTGTASATDICDSAVDVTFEDEVIPGICPQSYTIERTWTATDDCGNTDECVQTIEVADTTPPVCVDVTIELECDEDSSLDANPYTAASDNCDMMLTFQYLPGDEEEMPVGDCAQNRDITRKWLVLDDCLNTNSCTQTLEIRDTTPPVITVPGDVEIECDESTDPSNTGMASVTDNCDTNPDLTFSDVTIEEDCGYTIIRTWSAVDECGNSCAGGSGGSFTDKLLTSKAEFSGSEAYIDFEGFSGGTIIEEQYAALGIHFSAPTSPTEPRIFGPSGTHPSNFLNNFYDDGPDNGPGLGVPIEITFDTKQNRFGYFAGINEGSDLTWTFTCMTNNTIVGIETFDLPGGASNGAFIGIESSVGFDMIVLEVTGSNLAQVVIDEMRFEGGGENNCPTQTIRVLDTTPPSVMCPDNATVECGMDTDPSATGEASATDNCTDMVGVDSDDGAFMPACGETGSFERTWTATDDCDNTSTCVQTITIVDTTPPDIACPADVDVECDELDALDNTGVATATDICDSAVDVTFEDDVIPGICPQSYTIERTWTATDDCGNTDECVQTIQVSDTTPPVCMDVTIELECDEDSSLDANPYTAASDNCDMMLTFQYLPGDEEEIPVGDCEQNRDIIRKWLVLDDCLNTNSCTQTLEIRDTQPPVLTCPTELTIECDESTGTANTGMATATDVCSDFTITMSDVTMEADCQYTIERTFNASDACGNAAEPCVQTIIVLDTQAPVITGPADMTFECDDITVEQGDLVEVTQTFTYTGGNISWSDGTGGFGTPPVASPSINVSLPAGAIITDVNVSLGIDHSWTSDLEIELVSPELTSVDILMDNCSGNDNVNATFDDDGSAIACGGTTDNGASETCNSDYLLQASISGTVQPVGSLGNFNLQDPNGTWTLNVSDDAGGDGGCLQEFSIEITYLASQPVVQAGTATASDVCDPDPVVTFEDEITPGSCDNNYTLVRTFTATDNCGNSSTYEQTIVVEDTTPPVITCADDITAECDMVDEALASLIDPAVSDNCSAVTITSDDETLLGGCPGDYTIVRTYTATDACGNSSTCERRVEVSDNTAPMIVCPADVTVDCADDTEPNVVTSVVSVSPSAVIPDFGFTTIEIEVSVAPGQPIVDVNLGLDIKHAWVEDLEVYLQSPTGATCPIVILDDNCGTGDNVDAIFDDEAEFTIEEVCSNLPAIGGTVKPLDPLSMFDGQDPNGTWKVIIVDDEAAIAGTVDGIQLIIGYGTGLMSASAMDNCDDDVVVTFSDNVVPGECPIVNVIERTFTATDDCGNTSTCTQLITVKDTEGPTITCPDDIILPADKFFCERKDVELGVATVEDICDEAYTTVLVRSDGDSLNAPYPVGVTTITYTVTGECSGGTDECVQTVTIIDDQAPTVICKKIAVALNSNLGKVQVPDQFLYDGAFDNCPGDITVEVTQNIFECTDIDDFNTNEVLVEIIANDAAGNFKSCFTKVKLQDNFDPIAVCQDVTVTLDDNDEGSIIADDVDGGSTDNTDACGLELSVDPSTFGLADVGMTTTTLTVTDFFGNTATCVANVLVKDGPNSGQILVTAKLWMEGAMNASQTAMIPAITDIMPLQQPYTSYGYNGSEEVEQNGIPADAIDWVLIQLRAQSDPSIVIDQRAGFLMSNGLISDLTGTAPISFGTLTEDNYYISVVHRNHLAVISNAPVQVVSGTVANYDFTAGGTMGTDSQKLMANNEYSMWCGDVNLDGKVDASDRSITWNERNQLGYLGSDATLDGKTDASDRSITWNNRNKVSGLPQ